MILSVQLLEIMKDTGVKVRDRRVMLTLHEQQKAVIHVGEARREINIDSQIEMVTANREINKQYE